MAYIENPFRTGQVVRCIKDCSTVIVHSTNPALKGTVGAYPSPKEGDILTVDEVLGEYLRFDRYDDMEGDGYNWWFHTNFRPLSEAEAYLVEEGLDLEEEIKYGKSVIERIRSRIATNAQGLTQASASARVAGLATTRSSWLADHQNALTWRRREPYTS